MSSAAETVDPNEEIGQEMLRRINFLLAGEWESIDGPRAPGFSWHDASGAEDRVVYAVSQIRSPERHLLHLSSKLLSDIGDKATLQEARGTTHLLVWRTHAELLYTSFPRGRLAFWDCYARFAFVPKGATIVDPEATNGR